MEKATFAAGCFWEVQILFEDLDGVESTVVGYTDGNTENPSYEEVYTDKTGHAEAIEIVYNPEKVNYEALLDIFWNNHNPTTLNQQGEDVGTRYRSAIFYHNDEQKRLAEESMKAFEEVAQKRFKKPIVTVIHEASSFYKAEDYHQSYLKRQGKTTCSL